MKIERSPVSVAMVTESTIKGKRAENTGLAADPSVITELKFGNASSAADIDMAKVDKIRDAISNGTLKFDPEQIADGLIKSMMDLG